MISAVSNAAAGATAGVTVVKPPALPPEIRRSSSSVRVGAVTAASRFCWALAASAFAYQLPATFKAPTNCSWNASIWVLTVTYSSANAENRSAAAADTSSAAAAANLVVEAAATAFSEVIAEPMPARSVAAAASASGAMATNDIGLPRPAPTEGLQAPPAIKLVDRSAGLGMVWRFLPSHPSYPGW